jgi:hypothetical protein
MMTIFTKRGRIYLLVAAALAASAARPAWANDDEDGARVEGPSATPNNSAREIPQAPATTADHDTPTTGGIVEQLPPTAYPEWTPRGLYGGSLWLTMHGMPWPYTPRSGIGLSGSVWNDSGYETITRGNQTEANINYLVNQARAVLRVTPTYTRADWYVQGQSEFVLNSDQSVPQPTFVSTDDLWIRAGKWKKWDVTFGRFEAFEVYHFGMGMDLNTLERQGPVDTVRAVPDVPGLTTFQYRPSGAANAALHLYPFPHLRLELLGQYGFDAASSLDAVGARPAAVFDIGWLKVKGAAYWRKQFPVRSTSKELRLQSGFVGAVQLVLAPYIELGVNAARELVDHYNSQNVTDPNASMGDYDGEGSVTDLAVGGFANVRVVENFLLGAGLNYVKETDQVSGEFSNTQGFVAAQYLVGGGLFVKVVGGYAKAHLHPGGKDPWDNTMTSARVRLLYLF